MGGIVRLQLLGPFQAERDRAALRGFESRKAMALLCYLAVQVHPISRSYLANLFWGDKPEGRGRGNLSRVLHNLSTLLPGCLQADRHTVQFRRRPKFWLDVDAFDELAGSSAVDSLAKAFELYRGDFLAGFHLDDCPEFETWLVVERERWHQRAAQVLQKLLDHYSRGGEYERGLGFAARLLELDPWREEAHRQMMFLLAQSGQRSAALAQFETCRHILAEELGVEPATETTALYQRIRDDDLSKNVVGPLDYTQHSQGSGDQILSPAPPHLRTPAPPAFLAAASPQPGLTAPFVARQQELAGLEAFLELALAGQGRVAFVVGEAGRGKTALIEEFSRRAQDRYADLIVAGGNCNAYTGIGDPYLPFREILSLLSGDFEARWLAGIISPEHARRLWSLMSRTVQALVEVGPDLIDIFIPGLALVSRAAAAEPGDAAWLAQLKRLVVRDPAGQSPVNLQQRVLFEQYARVLQVLARKQPLLLVLDDLQWADAGSTSLLFHLGRQLKGSRILIAGLYRPAEVSGREGERHPLEGVVHEFQRHFGDIQIDLGQAVGKLFVEAFLDTEPNRLGPEFREVLYRHTRGHALFTIEMVRGMQERGDLIQDEAGRWVEGQNVDWQRLPARVEGVIGERLGRLPATLQEVLKVASVDGEHFTA
jgi:DNA-binding SARP family transcriptional activator